MMKWLRLSMVMLLLGIGSSAWAARMIPPDMQVAVLKSAQAPNVVLGNDKWSWLRILTLGWLDGSTTYPLSANFRMRNQQNLFEVSGRLPAFTGEAVAVRINTAGQIEEMWILTPQEREILRQRAVMLEEFLKKQKQQQ